MRLILAQLVGEYSLFLTNINSVAVYYRFISPPSLPLRPRETNITAKQTVLRKLNQGNGREAFKVFAKLCIKRESYAPVERASDFTHYMHLFSRLDTLLSARKAVSWRNGLIKESYLVIKSLLFKGGGGRGAFCNNKWLMVCHLLENSSAKDLTIELSSHLKYIARGGERIYHRE